MQFVCVTRPDLEATNRLLEAACAARGLDYVAAVAGALGGSGLDRSGAPLLLYRPAADLASMRLEKLLYGPKVASFYDPHFPCDNQAILLQASGIPTARMVSVPAADPARRAGQVAWLGGFPVVVKVGGHEGGEGVHLIACSAALDRLLARFGAAAQLFQHFPHRLAYRLVVVGARVVDCAASAPGADDFRSNGPGSRDLGRATPPPGAAALACRAAAALRLEFAGVDLLVAPDGESIVSEVNCPCYFAGQQLNGGVDIAGAMVDHLCAKSAGG